MTMRWQAPAIRPRPFACAARVASAALALSLLFGALPALAQAPGSGVAPEIPQLPRGNGEVRGQLEHPDGSQAAAGANVVLYGLAADGAPGVRDTIADAEGRFRFEGVSTAEGAAYLIGARHRGIPFFGPRVSFAAGQTSIEVRLAVSDPISDTSGVRPTSAQLVLEWGGNELEILESHRLETAGQQVIVVAPEQRAQTRAPLEVLLPEGAREFAAAPPSTDDSFSREGRRVRFWGPIYPGEQDVRFSYRMPIASPAPQSGDPGGAEGDREAPGFVRLQRIPSAGVEFSVFVPEAAGLVVTGEGLSAAGSESVADRPYRRFAYQPSDPRSELRIQVPRVERDRSSIGLERADFRMEIDDTVVSVTAEYHLQTNSRAHVVGTPLEPALVIPLPEGAELVGLAPSAREMGAMPMENGVGLAGPIPPGASGVALRFRMPTDARGTVVPLRVPLEAAAVNVLVADTGVTIESDRLHRRRPFQSGTRTFLHRQAYRVQPDETIAVGLRPISRAAAPPVAVAGGAVLAMVGATFFLIGPLLAGRRERDATDHENPWAVRREAIVQDIRDLDHDFETGKIGKADYDELRARLRSEAIELLRREGAGEGASPS